jgi:hypothetical protein
VRQRIVLTAFVLAPVVVLGAILLIIRYSRPAMNAPAVGAGASGTAGANAIGEWLAHGSAKPLANPAGPVGPESLPQGFVLVVTDASQLASPPSPIYLASNLNNWNPADPAYKLTRQSDGRWRIGLGQPPDGRAIEFKFTRGSRELEELDADLNPVAKRTLTKIDASALPPGVQPSIELTVSKWGDQRPTTK